MKKADANVSKKIKNYRLHMAGITQNKQKCVIFSVVHSKNGVVGGSKKVH